MRGRPMSEAGSSPRGDSLANSDLLLRDAGPSEPPLIRMGLTVSDAESIRNYLDDHDATLTARLLDQLWLRSVLLEHRRRVRLAARLPFDERADRLLAALDP